MFLKRALKENLEINEIKKLMTKENVIKEKNLNEAISRGNLEVLKAMIEINPDIIKKFFNSNCRTKRINLLHIAVIFRKLEICRYLLETYPFDVNHIYQLGPPLYFLVYADNSEVLSKNTSTIFYMKIEKKQEEIYLKKKEVRYEIAKLLLDHGSNPNFKRMGLYPIFDIICERQEKDLAILFLTYGATITPAFYQFSKETREYILKAAENALAPDVKAAI